MKKTRQPSQYGYDTIDQLESNVLYLLHVVSNRLTSSAGRIYRALFDLTVSEWRLLIILSVAPDITANRACQIMALDKGATSRLIGSLEKRGLIRAARSRSDSRERSLRLTQHGWRLYHKAYKVTHRRNRRLLSTLTAGQIAVLFDSLKRLDQQALAIPVLDSELRTMHETTNGHRRAGRANSSSRLKDKRRLP